MERWIERKIREIELKTQDAQDRQKWKRDHCHRPPIKGKGAGEEEVEFTRHSSSEEYANNASDVNKDRKQLLLWCLSSAR